MQNSLKDKYPDIDLNIDLVKDFEEIQKLLGT